MTSGKVELQETIPHFTRSQPASMHPNRQSTVLCSNNESVATVITLALQLVRHGMAAFPPRELGAALDQLRYDHPALQL